MHVSQHWRLKNHRYQLRAERHEDGTVSFPPRPDVAQRVEEEYTFEATEESKRKLVHVA